MPGSSEAAKKLSPKRTELGVIIILILLLLLLLLLVVVVY